MKTAVLTGFGAPPIGLDACGVCHADLSIVDGVVLRCGPGRP